MCSRTFGIGLVIILLAAPQGVLWAADPAQLPERTVIDNIRGGFFTSPVGDDKWGEIGMSMGRGGGRYKYELMDPQAIKGIHARLQHFEQLPEAFQYSYFPTPLLQEYETDEVRQGRIPIWCTATYEGKKRKLIWSWHLDKWGQSQPVNIADDRFIDFFINNYVRKTLNKDQLPNWWVGLDNFTFNYSLYGVKDDQDKFVPNVTWDKPFPQNNEEWMKAGAYCVERIRKIAPDVRLIANEAVFPDENFHKQVFANVDGVMFEGFLGYGDPEHIFDIIKRCGEVYKDHVQVFQFQKVDANDSDGLRKRYCAYLICTGKNGFFNVADRSSREIDPAVWADMKNALGDPVGAAIHQPEQGKSQGHRLHWRAVQGGMVYLNRTGGEKSIPLPEDRAWYDRNGNKVTELTIADNDGDYVTLEKGPRAAKPTINPRCPSVLTGPVAVTLKAEPYTTGAAIRYTLDGNEPNAKSAIYTAPITLTKDAVVKAKAFKEGLLDSFTSTAGYKIKDEAPQVEFHLAAENANEFLCDRFALVALGNVCGKTVTVQYDVTGGSADKGSDYQPCSGKVTFQPGEQYRFFPIEIVNDTQDEPDETIEITLSNPVNARLGAKKTYTYTILDND